MQQRQFTGAGGPEGGVQANASGRQGAGRLGGPMAQPQQMFVAPMQPCGAGTSVAPSPSQGDQPWLQWWCNQIPTQPQSVYQAPIRGDNRAGADPLEPLKPDPSPSPFSSDSESIQKQQMPVECSGNAAGVGAPPPEYLYAGFPLGQGAIYCGQGALLVQQDGMAQVVCQQGAATQQGLNRPVSHDLLSLCGGLNGITIKNTFLDIQTCQPTSGMRMVRTAAGRLDLLAEEGARLPQE
uniref:Uncharacterized protein n=1 Tax=Zooxanthella nutricula TaxID=1333877 RepID=A0A7S2PHA7_9DINO